MSDSPEIEPTSNGEHGADELGELEVNPMVHLIAPVAAIVGTMVVRKVVGTVYSKMTGRPAPDARDPRTPAMRAFMWAAVISATTAMAEVAIYRAIQNMGEKEA